MVGERRLGVSTTGQVFCVLALLGGCTSEVGHDPSSLPGVGGGGAGSGGSAGTAGAPPIPGCAGTDVAVPKRVVRLTFNQIANSLKSLTTDAEAAAIATEQDIGDSEHRTFPPLASPREGSTITDTVFSASDRIAQSVGKYAYDNLAGLTTCGAAPTDECAQTFVLGFAQRAFRRPLNDAEQADLKQVLTDVKTAGGTAAHQVQYGVYAAMSSPHFLYRTELGRDAAAAGALTSHEIASQLAFFLTDAPPDAPLLEAAAQGALATPEALGAQVQRILQTPSARQNLQDAMFSYFGLYGLETVIVDSPDFNDQVRASMYHEAQLFLGKTLWDGKLSGLITNRKSTINAPLAKIYGIELPASTVLDADGFGEVELPDTRSGMLTQSGFLTARSRPDQPSVVGRGLLVNSALLCAINPSFPEALSDQIDAASAMLAQATEREKADYRGKTPPCSGCHTGFDPYGLSLSNFDSIGRFVTADAQGRPIDASVTLPPLAGGATVQSASQMAAALAGGTGFADCMAKNLLLYALAEIPTTGTAVESVKVDGCATKVISKSFQATGAQSFTDLVTQVVVSSTLGQRSAGLGAP